MRFVWCLSIVVSVLTLFPAAVAAEPLRRGPSSSPLLQAKPDVQAFLDAQPGVLKSYQDEGKLAAAIIESNSLYYSLDPYLYLALLETTSALLSDPNPPASTLRQPFGPAGPDGFAQQIEWASQELLAGLGPYNGAPLLKFTDGNRTVLDLDQQPEWIAVQQFLAIGRTLDEWQAAVDRFRQVVQASFAAELGYLFRPPSQDAAPPPPTPSPAGGFLHLPWPHGTRVEHLAYFDHVYPTVDSGSDLNNVVYTYQGIAEVQYNTHDGHDYWFPDQPVGTPILAAAPGVAYARTHRGNGVVIIHENGYETVYWHLNSFAPRFHGAIDSSRGVWVEPGDVLGTSGSSGFVYGTPHLHFEVRHNGKQVDPYGWQSFGPDPCSAYAACEASSWLWHDSLTGLYDFFPPDSSAARRSASDTSGTAAPQESASHAAAPSASVQGGSQSGGPPQQHTHSHEQTQQPAAPAGPYDPHAFDYDQTPPLATLSINPPADVLLYVGFEGHMLQDVGNGFPTAAGEPAFESGRIGQAVRLSPRGGLAYPVAGNISPAAGSLSLWAYLPATYAPSNIGRHYLLAASAHPHDLAHGIYTGTLALRRDMRGPDGTPHWNFWTTPQSGAARRHDLAIPDTLEPGWHHFVITWDAEQRSKALYINGRQAAAAAGVALPDDIGALLQLGRFSEDSPQSGVLFDELTSYGFALDAAAVARLADSSAPPDTSASVVYSRTLLLDTNASDTQSGIVNLQIGRDGSFVPLGGYYDAFQWQLPAREGPHTLAARYFDHAGNSALVTRTVTLDLPPRGTAALQRSSPFTATLAISATDRQQPIAMQVSTSPDFAAADWQPVQPQVVWAWQQERIISSKPLPPLLASALQVVLQAVAQQPPPASALPPLYIRFRDGGGHTTPAMRIAAPAGPVYLPLVQRAGRE